MKDLISLILVCVVIFSACAALLIFVGYFFGMGFSLGV